MLYNHDAEKSVIGALLQDELKYLPQLTVEDFDKQENRDIFEAILSLHANKDKVDVQTVNSELARRNIDHTAYMLEACRWVPTTANTGSYVRIVLECSLRRKLYNTYRKGADKIADGMTDIDEVVQSVGEETKNSRAHGKGISFQSAFSLAYNALDSAMKGEAGTLKYGFGALDAMTGGMWKGQNIVVAGTTGTGKSAFAMDVAVNNLLLGKRAMICSREMTVEQYAQRIWARLSGVDLRRICDGEIGDSELELLGDKANIAANFKGDFLTDVFTVEELRSVVEANTPDFLIVDYLQLMDTKKNIENEVIRLGKISLTLKQIALECDIPVLSLSQLKRQEGRAAVMPILKDLRGSGNIEQDADVVIFLHQPDGESDPYIRPEDNNLFKLCKASEDKKRYIAVNVAKQRQGRLGAFQMIFEPSIMRFTAIDRNR